MVGDFFGNGLEQLYLSHSHTQAQRDVKGSSKKGEGNGKRKRAELKGDEGGTAESCYTLTDLNWTIATEKGKEKKRTKEKEKETGKGKEEKTSIRRYVEQRNEAGSSMSLQHVAYSLYSQLINQRKAQQAARMRVRITACCYIYLHSCY